MSGILPFVIGAAVLAVLAVLVIGVGNMLRKDHDPRTSNKLMQWRVGLQLLAVVLLVIFLLLSR